MINLRGLGECFLDEGNTIPCPDTPSGILLTAVDPVTGKSVGGSYYAVPVMQNPNAPTPSVLCTDSTCLMTGPNPSRSIGSWLTNNKDALLALSALVGVGAVLLGRRK